jgi:hypothetical protein
VVGEPDAALDVDAAVELYEPPEAAETYQEMMRRVWGKSAPFRERGVDPADGHRISNVEHIPGSFANPYTFPPLDPPWGASRDEG